MVCAHPSLRCHSPPGLRPPTAGPCWHTCTASLYIHALYDFSSDHEVLDPLMLDEILTYGRQIEAEPGADLQAERTAYRHDRL
jgi:hypothetical protein